MSTPRLRILQPLALAALVAAIASSVTAPVQADPLPGRDVLKFRQLPMDNLQYPVGDPVAGFVMTTFWGHDEFSTAYQQSTAGPPRYVGAFMADDFADRFSSPVVHVKWWGSYPAKNPDLPVDRFLISFEADVPANPTVPGSFSRPGQPLVNQVVTRGPLSVASGTFTEKLISPGGPPLHEELYEYNAELSLGFPQMPNTVYWLKIVALVDAPGFIYDPAQPVPPGITQWGWHNRDHTKFNPLASIAPAVDPGEKLIGYVPLTPAVEVFHFQDDAVTGPVIVDFAPVPAGPFPQVIQDPLLMRPTNYLDLIDGPGVDQFGQPGISQYSKDLAFELYTVPEPSGCLLALAALSFLAVGRCKK